MWEPPSNLIATNEQATTIIKPAGTPGYKNSFIPFIKEARAGFWQIIIFMVVGYLLYEFFIGY